MLETTLEIGLTKGELWYLLEQFSPTVVVGIENPYLGWLAAEVESAEEAALKSLLERDLVRLVSDREIALDQALAAMVGTLARADHSLIVQSQQSGGIQRRCYVHFGGSLIVKQVEKAPNHIQLTAFPDKMGLTSHLSDVLRPSSPSIGQGEPFQLPEANLLQARAFAMQGQAQEAIDVLAASGLDQATAQRLHRVLVSPVANSAVVVLVNRAEPETQHVTGFAVLEGETEMWILQPFERSGRQLVSFVPTDSTVIQKRFLSILP